MNAPDNKTSEPPSGGSEEEFLGFEEWEKPTLRIFLSADIVGSTAYKQKALQDHKPKSRAEDDAGWFSTVLRFYQQANQAFLQDWITEKKRCKRDSVSVLFGDDPQLWKTVGDEVLFTKVITHPGQVVTVLNTWILTLKTLRDTLKKKSGLDVKSSAWLADFPERNCEIVLSTELDVDPSKFDYDQFAVENHIAVGKFHREGGNRPPSLRDFIGPSIDTGFRLGGFASPRKLVVSVELAHMLSCEYERADGGYTEYATGINRPVRFDLVYEGRQPLKGVLSGEPYPVIWMDTAANDPLNQSEDLAHGQAKVSPSHIRAFTETFINYHRKMLVQPYVRGCELQPYAQMPVDMLESLKAWHHKVNLVTEQKQRLGEISKPPADAEPGANELNELTLTVPVGGQARPA